MSNNKKGQARHDEDMMAAAYEWAEELQEGPDCLITLQLAPTEQVGVWKVLAREHWCESGHVLGLRRSYTVRFPSSSYGTLAGALLDAVIGLRNAPVQERLPWLTHP